MIAEHLHLLIKALNKNIHNIMHTPPNAVRVFALSEVEALKLRLDVAQRRSRDEHIDTVILSCQALAE